MRLPVLFCAVLMSAALSRAGNAPQASFTPGLVSTAIASPQVSGIAIDGEGNIYVSDLYAGVVQKKRPAPVQSPRLQAPGITLKLDPSGNTLANLFGQPVGRPPVFDSDGNVYSIASKAVMKIARAAPRA